MSKSLCIEKTSKYIYIMSELKGLMNVINPNQERVYLEPDISATELGRVIIKKFSESYEITQQEFYDLWNKREELNKQNKIEEKRIIELYKYKNIKELYKDTLFLSVSILNNILYVTPAHQDGLGTFGTVRDNSGKAVQFEYPTDLSDEELGKAVMEGFKYCTSIYQKKK